MQGSVSGVPRALQPQRRKVQIPARGTFHSSSSTQIVHRATPLCSDAGPAVGPRGLPPPPRPQGRAGHGEPTPAQQRGGGVPYLGSGPAHPSLGRVLAPAARAPAARPLLPPPPRDVAGMQAAAAWASISRSQRRKSSAGLGHVPAPAPISALEFFSPFRPESGAGEGKEPTCWWSHRGQHRPQVWGPGDSHPPGAGAQPPRQERLGCAAPCRPLAANASVSRAAKGPAASRELQRLG